MYSGSRIVGGEYYVQNKYPFLVEIVRNKDYMFTGVYEHHCGGSLITVRNVISAGHCFHTSGCTMGEYGVRLGLHNRNDPGVGVIVNLHISRPQNYYFDGNTAINDIAMVTLPISVDFNHNIMPVYLPSPELDVTEQDVIIAGWGAEKFAGVSTMSPKELHTKVTSNSLCPDPTHLCTHTWEQTACSGDSGGPVVWLDPQTNWYTLVGVVSNGDFCVGHVPATQTRVTAYLTWIQDRLTAPLPLCTM
ncbi:hypothetical protein GE061_010077, partial [Apolygus lucorum]